jgi:hypothetical protein
LAVPSLIDEMKFADQIFLQFAGQFAVPVLQGFNRREMLLSKTSKLVLADLI